MKCIITFLNLVFQFGAFWSSLAFFLWKTTPQNENLVLLPQPKDSGKLKLDQTKITEFWNHTCNTGWLEPNHPGNWGANVIGFYGDDARYTKGGEKLISLAWNAILQEPERHWVHFSIFLFNIKYFLKSLHCTYTQSHKSLSWSPMVRLFYWGLDLARFPICVLRCSLVIPDYTLRRVYCVIAWSFQVSRYKKQIYIYRECSIVFLLKLSIQKEIIY